LSESIWFTTRSALFRPGDAAWNEIAAYAGPLRRLLDRRYGWLPESERDDVVQDVLLEMKQGLVVRHDERRGRFRALLQTVVERRVADRHRHRRARSLDSAFEESLGAPPLEEVAALDLEALLIEAVAACRDRFTQGAARDHDVVFALSDRVVRGLTNVEIAKATGASEDRVARLLERARDAIFAHLLERELAVTPDEGALSAFKEALRRPREAARTLEKLRDPGLAERLEGLVAGLRAALERSAGDDTASGQELRAGLAFVLGSA
jgi:DNA-directed RNA polymerase specialized sigma24 family protein